MNGFHAYKYYLAVKLHFTTKKFNVFENPYVKGTIDSFCQRNDRTIFEALGKKYETSQKVVQFYVSNLCLGFQELLYNQEIAEYNYKSWITYKESKSYMFTQDLYTAQEYSEKNNIDLHNSLWSCYLNKSISIQSIHICNEIDDTLNKIDSSASLLFEDDLLRINKLKKFIKIDENIQMIYEKVTK